MQVSKNITVIFYHRFCGFCEQKWKTDL